MSGKVYTALDAVGLPVGSATRLRLAGERGSPGSRLAVEEIGSACIGAALLAAARLHEARTGERLTAGLDRAQVRAALVSERLFRADGQPASAGFAPQSRFWPAADGWVRTHANYSWHHDALLRAVDAANDKALAAAVAALPAAAVEERVFEAGGVAAAVRPAEHWRSDPQGRAVAAEPLVERVRTGEAEPRRRAPAEPSGDHSESDAPPAPAAGIRVLDLTRVIAGPVCSRYLGALGADVLRIDPPGLPDLELGRPADTLLGKRSAFLDLSGAAGVRRLEELLAGADAVLLGYRPGSLARFGLDPEELSRRHPGLVVVELTAWGHSGPWAGRRGFDSIVQSASGIAAIEAAADGQPGALPCQLLDHGTGYLAAAATLAALAEQEATGGSHLRRVSLARTADWLIGEGEADNVDDPGARWDEPGAAALATIDGDPALAAVPPPGSLDGAPLRWRGQMGRYGAGEASW